MSKSNKFAFEEQGMRDVTPGYDGSPLFREGGVRGGGVSELETLPAEYPYPKKIGYDEHKTRGASPGGIDQGTVHGLPGVEGMDPPSEKPGDHGMADERTEDTPMTDGFACGHGCGSMKSKHGLARHTFAKHGGFGGLGHAIAGVGKAFKAGASEGKDVDHKRIVEDAPKPGHAKTYTTSLYEGERASEKHGLGYGKPHGSQSSYASGDGKK